MKFVRIIQPFWSTLLPPLIFASSARAQPSWPYYEPQVGQGGRTWSGSHAAGPGRQDVEHGGSGPRAIRHGPAARVTAARSSPPPSAACGPWYRVQSGHGRALEAQRGGRRGSAIRQLSRKPTSSKAIFPKPGDHDVSAARHQYEAAAQDSGSQARDPHRLEHFYDGRLGRGRDFSRITEDCTTWCTAPLWMVPAKVPGGALAAHAKANTR